MEPDIVAPNHHILTQADLGIRHFSPAEFRGWWSLIDPRWLVCADLLREMTGLVMVISPHPRAIGRNDGAESKSDHNVDRWGRVYGVDVMPRWKNEKPIDATIAEQAFAFHEIAKDCGFTAIGYYPDWRNAKGEHNPGFHLGTRRSGRAGAPATWGRINEADGPHDIGILTALNLTSSRMT